MRKSKGMALIMVLAITGCTSNFEPFSMASPPRMTPVQECAIGYDLAQQIYTHVSLTETVIIAPRRKTGCETYAIAYLQQAGFKIDDRGARGGFEVEVVKSSSFVVTATAVVGERLKLSRNYELAETGVYGVSDVTILELPAFAELR
ncbi:hypothetical protein [Cognatiyoonia sp. IB215182]|uniref:hypothetical protein n=1 Tax=Cognatiyoonia sp. IB215182 TaxID=3097353 RepID=UPI002A14EA24|nr:hypothetical protein [Cognatiyoonia sp. IB215182]MDX8355398.1 hypothetical protein [Cognatiyoonia sp. IB215182]